MSYSNTGKLNPNEFDEVFNLPTWSTTFTNVDLLKYNQNVCQSKYIKKEAKIRLITRSGFEQKYIYTSQIASM